MWDTKYRPLTFGDVLGQEGTVQLLKARLSRGSALDTNYIFSGGHGQGKTTLARILARAMLCLNLDKSNPEPCNTCDNCSDVLQGAASAFVEQDAASGGTIDNIRAIVDDLPFAVFNAPKRVYVFDEAHRMSRDAQDVLLKPLEEKRMVGIFCTTEKEKIRGTIRSRCESYAIRKVTREDVLVRMNKILDLEGVEHEDDATLTVIDFCGGHVRDVLNKLEMIAQMGAINTANVREYLHLSAVGLFFEILLALGDPRRSILLVEQALEQVAPEEVSAGLAEAAMNSFRLAHGLYAEFTYVDKELAQRVYAAYGDSTVKIAEYFLRTPFASKVSLICDVLALQSGLPVAVAPTLAAPIQVVVNPLSEVRRDTPPTDASPVVVGVSPSPSLPMNVLPLSTPTPPKAPVLAGGRGDGVGNLGGGDVAALTEFDDRAVPRGMPRKRAVSAPTLNLGGGKNLELSEILSPDHWRRDFELSWLALGKR